MSVPITGLYAGLLGLVAIALGVGSGRTRFATGVSLGDGGDARQLVAFRRHGNFCEWVPLALILLAVLELNAVSATALHALGASLFVARVVHPFGLSASEMRRLPRGLGALATVLVVAAASLTAIATYF